MGANLDVGVLRSFLGEHSESVWSDADLRGNLDIANTIVWKILSDQAPDMVAYNYLFKVGTSGTITFTNAVTTVSSGIIDASTSGIGVPVSSVRAVYETKSPPGDNPSYKKLKVKAIGGHYPVFESSNTIFDDLELPDIYQDRMAVFNYGAQEVILHPKPTKDKTYVIDLITETPVYIKSGATTTRTRFISQSNTDEAELLGVERFHPDDDGKAVAYQCHLAVIMEAAYQASFSDKSLRREFASERDRLIALTGSSHTTSIDEAY